MSAKCPKRNSCISGSCIRAGLAPQKFLLVIHIFLRDVASRYQRVNAGLGHVLGVLAETNIEKLATDSILVTELVVLPRACVLHSLGDAGGLRSFMPA